MLLYHRLGVPPFDPAGQAVAPDRFCAHLDLLRRHYRVSALPDLLGELHTGGLAADTVAVSFDDGYADTLQVAVPLAATRGVPLTVFVAAQPVLEGGLFWWDELAARVGVAADATERFHRWNAELKTMSEVERRRRLADPALGPQPPAHRLEPLGRPMTAAELRRLASEPAVTVGAHTWSHPTLSTLPIEEQRRELAEGRGRLEDLLGQPVDLLAYPFGKATDLSAATPRLAEETGFRAAFTSRAGALGAGSPRFELPRLPVHDWPAEELDRRLRACFGAAA